MSAHSADGAQAPSVRRLEGYDFEFVGSIVPERDALGSIRELSPQGRPTNVPLHKHGHGTFCTFHVAIQRGLVGVYALVVDGSVRYIGKCEDLGQRVYNYGNISRSSCYKGGQSTICKINHRVLEVSKAGGRVDLYFHPTPQQLTVKRHLVAQFSPPWNG